MTEINHFEDEIIEKAKQKAKDILQKAEQEAQTILDQARSERERKLKARIIEKEKEEEQKAQRELSRLRIKNKIELNNVKERLLNLVFTESLKQIQEWKEKKSEEYRSALANQIIQGGVSLEGGELTVKLEAGDVSLIDLGSLESEITKITGSKTSIITSTSESDVLEGGSIISKESLAVYNTTKPRFDRREDIIRDKVHNILFFD
ncbi:MAG: V-type ATP synthase subunit E [Candidatus Hodarchaeales archaeon]|jgi:vacuolar-type H+-ATPase subunit E/Vma4